MKFSRKELIIFIITVVVIIVGYFGTKWYVANRYDTKGIFAKRNHYKSRRHVLRFVNRPRTLRGFLLRQ